MAPMKPAPAAVSTAPAVLLRSSLRLSPERFSWDSGALSSNESASLRTVDMYHLVSCARELAKGWAVLPERWRRGRSHRQFTARAYSECIFPQSSLPLVRWIRLHCSVDVWLRHQVSGPCTRTSLARLRIRSQARTIITAGECASKFRENFAPRPET